jgi:hypothetical protein
MNIVIEPTPEMFEAHINGAVIPVRIWAGRTQGGIPIEAYVLSITPNDSDDVAGLRAELPSYMKPSRETFSIDTRSDAERRAQHIHDTGEEPPDQP